MWERLCGADPRPFLLQGSGAAGHAAFAASGGSIPDGLWNGGADWIFDNTNDKEKKQHYAVLS